MSMSEPPAAAHRAMTRGLATFSTHDDENSEKAAAASDSEGENEQSKLIDEEDTHGIEFHDGFIRFGTVNIVSARQNRLNMALRSLFKMEIDVAILTETKLTDDRFSHYDHGFEVFASKARSAQQGGVALAFRQNSRKWHIEGVKFHSPNVVTAEVVTGVKRWLLVGSYIAPSETSQETITTIQKISDTTQLDIIWLGDFNTNLDQVKDARQAEISASVANVSLFDLSKHFVQKHKWTWRQKREGRWLRSTTDYFLVKNRTEWKNCKKVFFDGFDTDHLLIKGDLLVKQGKYHKYVSGRKKYPLKFKVKNDIDDEFAKLRKSRQKLPQQPPWRLQSWISAETWKLIDARAAGRRSGTINGEQLDKINKTIKKSIRRDKRIRTDKVGSEAEAKLASNDSKGAFKVIRGWYQKRTKRPPKPTREDLRKVRQSYVDLFEKEPIDELPFPVHIEPFEISDEIPEEEEIIEALSRLKLNKAPGPSKIRAEDLKRWRAADGEELRIVVKTVQNIFETGDVPQQLADTLFVLIPKSDISQFRGIGLIDILWKLASSIINRRLSLSICFHDGIHGFCRGRGTSTAVLETKLLMQLAVRTNVPLYQVFLDLSKAYDTLDRDKTLQILQDYGVGPRIAAALKNFWSKHRMVPKQTGYYGEPFMGSRGTIQGDISSPTIFNIVADAVIREWHRRINVNDRFVDWKTTIPAVFYADDGRIAGSDPHRVQRGLDLFVTLFEKVGLHMNASKTKSMVTAGARPYHMISEEAYKRKMTGVGEEYRARKARKVNCSICNASIAEQHVRVHMKEQHGVSAVRAADDIAVTFRVNRISMPKVRMKVDCPVPGCCGTASDRHSLRRHFLHRHPHDTIIIEEEGALQRCDKCDMFTPSIHSHQKTKTCADGAKRKAKRKAERERNSNIDFVFEVNGTAIERVTKFKYLGRWLSEDDDDYHAVVANIKKARQRWGMIAQLLKRDNAHPKTAAKFYKTVVQTVLLYGSETWTLSSRLHKMLASFHNYVARSLTRRYIYRRPDDTWLCPNSAVTLSFAGLLPIQTYIDRRKHKLMKFAETRIIYFHCTQAEAAPNAVNQITWW